jgi:uncharacterized repeat protein (TIGR01451 family)
VRHRRLSGAILAATAGLLAAAGRGHGQAPGAPPRLLDLESVAQPLPGTKWQVIAVSPPGAGAAGSPRPPAGPIRPVVYEPADPPPPEPAPARPFNPLPNGLIAGERASPPTAGAANTGKPSPGGSAAAAPPAAAPALSRAGSGLALEVVKPPQAAAGQIVPLEIIARNTGAVALTSVRVEVQMPEGTRLLRSDPPAELEGEHLAWFVEAIPAAAERHLRLEVQAAAGGEWSLTPTASFTVGQPLALRITGPRSVAPGTKAVFQVLAVNQTDQPMDKVVLRAQLPLGLFHPEAAKAQGRLDIPLALKPGETFKLPPLETQAVSKGRLVVEVATAPNSRHRAPPARTFIEVADPPLAVRLDGPRMAALGRAFDLHVEVGNPNAAPAANAVLAQSVPQGLEVVNPGPDGKVAPGGQGILWSLGTLAPGQRRAFVCTLRPRAAGDWPLYTVASADAAGEARTGYAIHVDAAALTLEVMGGEDALTVGAVTVYEIHVLNNSDLPATNVRLAALLPEELELVDPQGPTEARVQPAQVQFAPVARLDPHGDAVYRVRARARRPGNGRFRVEMTADQLARPLVQEAGALVQGGP